jgi:hypothetical protein
MNRKFELQARRMAGENRQSIGFICRGTIAAFGNRLARMA